MHAPPLFPPPLVDHPPSEWPAMMLYAATVLLEAEGEPDEGQLAVGYIIRNRVDVGLAPGADFSHLPDAGKIAAVVLAPWQFSCWNSDYAGQRVARLTGVDPARWALAWWATSAAWWRFLPDPTGNAVLYLNPDLARSIRGGSLPSWYSAGKVMATIGRHEFLRA